MKLQSIELLKDERIGQGGFLVLRRLRMRLLGADGARTAEGAWDFVERPAGLDAVVLVLWRHPGAPEVLLRSGLRVPLQFGRPEPQPMLLPELVAGILENGDDLRARAAAEALEEAGLRIDGDRFQPLGPPLFPSPGMCAELFNFVCAEVPDQEPQKPEGDGSPFEEGALLEWVALDEALRRCSRGEIQDMKTEIGLRRLREHLT
ncbi:MAG: NUDIX domain-containing protein [Myxococcales bacterium]